MHLLSESKSNGVADHQLEKLGNDQSRDEIGLG